MTTLNTLITPALTRCQLSELTTKKQVFEVISNLVNAANHQIKSQDVLEALQKREKLGNTAIGYGVAIPHARVKNLQQACCALLTLKNPIDFDNMNNNESQPVDLIFSLLVPEEATQTHLNLLSDIAEQLKNKTYRDQLRQATSNESLLKVALQKTHQTRR